MRITASAVPRAAIGLAARKRAATVGSSAGSGTSGRTESPISAMSGPLLGSVPPKVRTSPRPWPVTQYSSASTMPAPTYTPDRRESNGPRPMTTDAVAKSAAIQIPVPAKA